MADKVLLVIGEDTRVQKSAIRWYSGVREPRKQERGGGKSMGDGKVEHQESRHPKVVGSRKDSEALCNIVLFLAMKNCKEAGTCMVTRLSSNCYTTLKFLHMFCMFSCPYTVK